MEEIVRVQHEIEKACYSCTKKGSVGVQYESRKIRVGDGLQTFAVGKPRNDNMNCDNDDWIPAVTCCVNKLLVKHCMLYPVITIKGSAKGPCFINFEVFKQDQDGQMQPMQVACIKQVLVEEGRKEPRRHAFLELKKNLIDYLLSFDLLPAFLCEVPVLYVCEGGICKCKLKEQRNFFPYVVCHSDKEAGEKNVRFILKETATEKRCISIPSKEEIGVERFDDKFRMKLEKRQNDDVLKFRIKPQYFCKDHGQGKNPFQLYTVADVPRKPYLTTMFQCTVMNSDHEKEARCGNIALFYLPPK